MIDDHKEVLELTRTGIIKLIHKLQQEPEKNKDEIAQLHLHLTFVKNDLKNVKEYAYGIDESANLSVLSLPNFLHKKTPLRAAVTVHDFLEKPKAIKKCHMEIGENLIEYLNPNLCFLKSEASLFELALTNYFQSNLLKSGLVQFSNPDFARSVVVEGCGTDKSKIFTIGGSDGNVNKLHVVGGGSLHSFMAYFARNSIHASALPLKFFSLGRKYAPVTQGSDLFDLSQNSVAQIFVATENDRGKTDAVLDTLTQQIIGIYEPLGYHFKVVYASASDLEKGESLRVSIQMFSNYSQKYVEIGNLSLYDDYLSKRLLFTYSIHKERKFLRVISGEVLHVHKCLACVIENNFSNNKPLLSDVLQKYL